MLEQPASSHLQIDSVNTYLNTNGGSRTVSIIFRRSMFLNMWPIYRALRNSSIQDKGRGTQKGRSCNQIVTWLCESQRGGLNSKGIYAQVVCQKSWVTQNARLLSWTKNGHRHGQTKRTWTPSKNEDDLFLHFLVERPSILWTMLRKIRIIFLAFFSFFVCSVAVSVSIWTPRRFFRANDSQ
jgi:hypothetical protein